MTIELHDLSFTYAGASRPALSGLTLSVAPGEVCGVLGRSGAGKSTLSLLLSGFMPQFFAGDAAGSARVADHDVLAAAPSDLARSVALVLSDPFGQISGTRFTVLEEVAFGLENLGLPRDELRARSEWALATLGIADLRDRSPYELSGGQQQRLVLASALAVRPQVLVLDQPAAQLDPRTVAELAATLREIARGGTTIVVAEARAGWLQRLADSVLVLHEGGAQRHGPADVVLRDELLPALGIRPVADTLITRQANTATDGTKMAAPPSTTLLSGQAAASPGRAGAALVAVENVSFRYPTGVAALKDVRLRIGGGERIALLGRNGAGKSTLLRQLNGLLRPTAGRVLVRGEDTRRATVARCARTVALSFQDVRNQLFARSVGQELLFGPRNLGYTPARCNELVAAALEATELTPFVEEHPYDLLPQQRRMVAIAAALAMDTPLLVLDEPGAGMDDAGLALLARIIDGRVAQGASVLVVSHDVAFAASVTERVLLMAGGELRVDSPWGDLDANEQALLAEEVGLPHQGIRAHNRHS